ncbi:MAG: hypothetical protein WBQ10_18050 [Terriglobales bacterium]
MKTGKPPPSAQENIMTERRNIRLLKHRNEIELSCRNWVLAALELSIALGIAFLGGYAVYCFMTRFGE